MAPRLSWRAAASSIKLSNNYHQVRFKEHHLVMRLPTTLLNRKNEKPLMTVRSAELTRLVNRILMRRSWLLPLHVKEAFLTQRASNISEESDGIITRRVQKEVVLPQLMRQHQPGTPALWPSLVEATQFRPSHFGRSLKQHLSPNAVTGL